jgi:hypothetical protein
VVVDGGLTNAAAGRQFNTSQRRWPNGWSASAGKGWMVCVTARQDLFHRPAKLRQSLKSRAGLMPSGLWGRTAGCSGSIHHLMA